MTQIFADATDKKMCGRKIGSALSDFCRAFLPAIILPTMFLPMKRERRGVSGAPGTFVAVGAFDLMAELFRARRLRFVLTV